MFDTYYEAHKALGQYGMFSCKCYNITKKVPSAFSKNPYKRRLKMDAISNLIAGEECVLTYDNVIHDKIDFIRHIIKPRLIKEQYIVQTKKSVQRKKIA